MSTRKKKGAKSLDPDAEPAGARTKAKLAAMMNAFDNFEGVMKEGTRVRTLAAGVVSVHHIIRFLRPYPYSQYVLQQRREKDEHRLAQLKQEMGTLEKTMSSEIKRRLEMSKSFQSVRRAAW